MQLFHRHNVRCVRITFKEDIGTKGRGGYFNSYGKCSTGQGFEKCSFVWFVIVSESRIFFNCRHHSGRYAEPHAAVVDADSHGASCFSER